ncbi:hypothetical protein [uncultured Fusobacterium sp.]|uniref:hypothetical protein n=1 Tax=uncultured Fusobacterium sp. TaxID=159267 RepID=UPI0025FDB99B|nr:hypothetical protein [uncultured Fusobacterium sp.]
MQLIIILEAAVLSMIIFIIDFAVFSKGNEDDYENNSYNSKKEALSIGKEGMLILISYLIISIFFYFFFRAEPIRSILYNGRVTLDSPFIADILRNISRVRGILLNMLIGLYGIRRRRSEGFIFIILSLIIPSFSHSFLLSNIFRFISTLLRILIFRKNILMIIYLIFNFLSISLFILGNMHASWLFYEFINLPFFNLLYSNMYWLMIIAIILEIIKIANVKDENEL